MKKLIAYYGDTPVCVEGFPEGCERSCEGALHIRPRTPHTVTGGEFGHMQKAYGWMMSKVRIISELKAAPSQGGKMGADEKSALSSSADAEAKSKKKLK